MSTRLMKKDIGFEIKKNPTASDGAADQVKVPQRMLSASNILPSIAISLLVHIGMVAFSGRSASGLEGWLFVFFNFVLWTLALIPLVATARRVLYWADPFFFLAVIFFLTACLGGVVFWIAPQSLQPLLVFVPISDIWTITEVILSFSLVWFIVLIINDSPEGSGLAVNKLRHRRTLVISQKRTIGTRNRTSPRVSPWNRPEMRQTASLRTLAIRQRALKVGYFFLVLGVFAWLGLFRSFDGYLDRLLRISVRVLAPGEGRYVSLLVVASFGALLLIPYWGHKVSRKPSSARFWTITSVALIALLLLANFPLGDRIQALMIVFLGLILIDRFVARIGVKWLLVMGFVVLVLITGARQYAQSDYEQLLSGAQTSIAPIEDRLNWSILLSVDRVGIIAQSVAKIRSGHPFIVGESALSALESIYQGASHFLLGSPLAEPRFWSMQAYTTYWQYGVPQAIGFSMLPSGVVGELYLNGGYLALLMGATALGFLVRWLRRKLLRAVHEDSVFFIAFVTVLITYIITTEVSTFLTSLVFTFLPVLGIWYLVYLVSAISTRQRGWLRHGVQPRSPNSAAVERDVL